MRSIEVAKNVIQTEIDGLDFMSSRLGLEFSQAVDAIIATKGRTIICGMGKSGLIGKKIVASLASTGTPSFFMHPGEAFHGDLGMVKPEDVFIAISNSGETDEVLKLLPFLRDNDNYVIALTGNENSTLAQNAHCHLDIAEDRPSHEGMGFETCASAGCHNFHDNRGLYEDFLLKHLHEADVLPQPRVATRDLRASLELLDSYPFDKYPVRELAVQHRDAPLEHRQDSKINHQFSLNGTRYFILINIKVISNPHREISPTLCRIEIILIST